MEVIIKGREALDPRQRVLALEAATQAICESVGQDPADGTMMLLTAACHVAMKHSGKSAKALLDTLAYSLGCATVAADDFFTLKQVSTSCLHARTKIIDRTVDGLMGNVVCADCGKFIRTFDAG